MSRQQQDRDTQLTSNDPIKLGSMLFTLVEPHRGHEVAYNRWYERDHFYAGCMIGPWQFAGSRWVATRDCKAKRLDTATPITPDAATGSYVAIYWVLDGHHDEWSRWAVDQVKVLHENGRMFAERDHIHTALYRYGWHTNADADGVPPELALDHRFAGLAVEVVDGRQGPSDPPAGVALTVGFSPIPLLIDAPGDVPRQPPVERTMLLHFLEGDPLAFPWRDDVVWRSPFLPTVVGTDTYTDQLW